MTAWAILTHTHSPCLLLTGWNSLIKQSRPLHMRFSGRSTKQVSGDEAKHSDLPFTTVIHATATPSGDGATLICQATKLVQWQTLAIESLHLYMPLTNDSLQETQLRLRGCPARFDPPNKNLETSGKLLEGLWSGDVWQDTVHFLCGAGPVSSTSYSVWLCTVQREHTSMGKDKNRRRLTDETKW